MVTNTAALYAKRTVAHFEYLPSLHWGGGGTLTLIMTKICDIPYPILYDLNKNSEPYSWPDPYIKILFQTCIIILLGVSMWKWVLA